MAKLILALLRFFLGVPLVDQRTGLVIGKVLVFGWKGKIRLVGVDGVAVVPLFSAQDRETYWAQDLAFATHSAPDYERVVKQRSDSPAVAPKSGGGVDDVPRVEAVKS